MTSTFDLPLTINEGIYSTIALKMAHGGFLYLDAWDHKPPFIFLAYYLIGLFLKNVEWQAHCLAIMAHVSITLLVVRISRIVSQNIRTSWICGIFYLILALPTAFQTWSGQADLLMQPFLLLAFSFALSKTRRSSFWAGVFWVGAFYFKQSALFYLPLFIYLSWDDALGLLSDFFWGVNALSLIVVAPFVLSGRLGLFWQAVMGANGNYVDSGWVSLFSRPELKIRFFDLLSSACEVYGIPTLVILGIFIVLAHKNRTKGKNDRRTIAPILFFACSILACCVSGFFYPYYFVAVLPALAILVSICLPQFVDRPRWQLITFLIAISAPEMVGIARYIANPEAELLKAGYSWPRMQEAKVVGEYLHQKADPNETLIVWAAEPQIYSYSNLQFQGIRTPLVIHLALIPGEEERFESALYLNPPDWFVVGLDSVTPPLSERIKALLGVRFHLDSRIGTKKLFKRT